MGAKPLQPTTKSDSGTLEQIEPLAAVQGLNYAKIAIHENNVT